MTDKELKEKVQHYQLQASAANNGGNTETAYRIMCKCNDFVCENVDGYWQGVAGELGVTEDMLYYKSHR
ncbi:hypothetical protein psyc5s11_53690 [Clostridium gelidum]|uniref:Uncharacterized protein n=1 Tax=Clostridium gelidum TaxID=704125 RepID=A0ABN6J4X3_9CLOT|nr:hypothetical protein [Clostridium gelidum]BCZ49302.1 hypothetical protein psyc5s11_53690 [Clostridium gelidum]